MEGNSGKDKTAVTVSIKWKLIAIMTVLMVSLIVILAFMQISLQTRMLEDALDKRITLMKENLIERGKSLIINLSQQVENDIAAFNFSGAMEAVTSRVENNEEIKYAILMDASGMTLVNTLTSGQNQEALSERDQTALNQTELLVREYQEEDESIIEIIHPIQISTQPWGVLRLMYTLKHLDEEIELSRKQIRQEISSMVSRSTLTALGFLGVSLIFVFFLSTTFSRPLIDLTQSFQKGFFGIFADSDSFTG
jgi:two-component system sensor histidine kinase/response regulator